MNCPACKNQLEQMKVGEITVDVCNNGCGGLWFDNYELKQVDEKHETAGERLLHVDKDPSISLDTSARRACPKCDSQIMMRHFMSVKRNVEIDECANCGGVWLDAGELGGIRDQFDTELEREQAADAYFADTFGDELDKMLEASEEKQKQARKFAKIFRFICPSYYIPGKQKWGAF